MMRINKEEFEKTVDTYSDVMFRCAYAYCNNRTDAEDIVQEAFVKYLKKSPQFEDEEHKKAWLLRVVINLSKNLVKSFWNRNKTDIDDNIPDEKGELTKCEIWEDVKRLPAKYRILVELYYGEGYTIEETAKITGVKKSTVSDRLKKARELLEKMYKEELQ